MDAKALPITDGVMAKLRIHPLRIEVSDTTPQRLRDRVAAARRSDTHVASLGRSIWVS